MLMWKPSTERNFIAFLGASTSTSAAMRRDSSRATRSQVSRAGSGQRNTFSPVSSMERIFVRATMPSDRWGRFARILPRPCWKTFSKRKPMPTTLAPAASQSSCRAKAVAPLPKMSSTTSTLSSFRRCSLKITSSPRLSSVLPSTLAASTAESPAASITGLRARRAHSSGTRSSRARAWATARPDISALSTKPTSQSAKRRASSTAASSMSFGSTTWLRKVAALMRPPVPGWAHCTTRSIITFSSGE
mmetsp:Transcript_56155/g.134183  ORF Transcript_56155/g.134183 Transcript_56155/m.134183 type:complete len:247 (-) Transcript_56155:461-1201(-)